MGCSPSPLWGEGGRRPDEVSGARPSTRIFKPETRNSPQAVRRDGETCERAGLTRFRFGLRCVRKGSGFHFAESREVSVHLAVLLAVEFGKPLWMADRLRDARQAHIQIADFTQGQNRRFDSICIL